MRVKIFDNWHNCDDLVFEIRQRLSPEALQKAWFTVEPCTAAFPGWWIPAHHWNGFAVPFFDLDTVQTIGRHFPQLDIHYTDNYITYVLEGERMEPDGGRFILNLGKHWHIGEGWTWQVIS